MSTVSSSTMFKTRFNGRKSFFPKNTNKKPRKLQTFGKLSMSAKIKKKNKWKMVKSGKNELGPITLCTMCNLKRIYIPKANRTKNTNEKK